MSDPVIPRCCSCNVLERRRISPSPPPHQSRLHVTYQTLLLISTVKHYAIKNHRSTSSSPLCGRWRHALSVLLLDLSNNVYDELKSSCGTSWRLKTLVRWVPVALHMSRTISSSMASRTFFFFFFFNLTYSRWTSLPSCLWSQRIFPSLPGSRLTIFYRDASSALLQLVKQWLNFT